MKFQFATIAILLSLAVGAQDTDRKIQFPNTAEHLTLKCDFHIHTVFSDGQVWPNIRVEEALKDGLDAISLTEHLEYQPWSDDIPHPDRNRSYHLAKEYVKAHDLLVIHGTEITRDLPPGHANALFIQDANKIMLDDAYEAYKAARDQGAFIFWNHPNWVSQEEDGIPQLSDFHKRLIKDDLLHGIEVVNELTYSEEAFDIALKNDLTAIGTSDIHGLVDWQFDLISGGHRPINLVFAKEKTEAAIKEALFAGRTVTWFKNLLTGKREVMGPLLDACLDFKSKGMIGPSSILQVEITNHSDARLLLQNVTDYDFYDQGDLIEALPHSTITVGILSDRVDEEQVKLKFKVMNAVVAYKENATMEVIIK